MIPAFFRPRLLFRNQAAFGLALALPLLVFSAAAAETVQRVDPAGARVVIGGNRQAKLCSDHARLAADGMMSPAFAVETCTEALQVEDLDVYDRAATHNNRGIVLLDMQNGVARAQADFNDAGELLPSLGESYVNLGASYLREGRFAEAVGQIEHGIELGVKEPWRAYFNRAVAREHLGQIREAYEDYMKAAELKPDWELPRTELARFQVVSGR